VPTKLMREPLIDAVFEMRFEADSPVSSILPGFLYSSLPGEKVIEHMPVMNIPKEFRENDPNFRYAPLIRISWGSFWLFVGDHVFSVSSKLPYPGWSALRSAVLDVFALVCKSGFITSISRCSMKYVDLISDESGMLPADIFDLSIVIGGAKAGVNDFQVRADIRADNYNHIVNLVSNASTHLIGTESPLAGSIVDIDTVLDLDSESPEEFLMALPDRADSIHSANKKLFFSSLTPLALNWLEPRYE